MFNSGKIKIKNKYYNPENVIICFSNGYSKNRDQFKIQCNGLEVSSGNSNWGAVCGEKYYIIKLGTIIKTKN